MFIDMLSFIKIVYNILAVFIFNQITKVLNAMDCLTCIEHHSCTVLTCWLRFVTETWWLYTFSHTFTRFFGTEWPWNELNPLTQRLALPALTLYYQSGITRPGPAWCCTTSLALPTRWRHMIFNGFQYTEHFFSSPWTRRSNDHQPILSQIEINK